METVASGKGGARKRRRPGCLSLHDDSETKSGRAAQRKRGEEREGDRKKKKGEGLTSIEQSIPHLEEG